MCFDQRFCLDSKITYSVAEDDKDLMVATYEIEGVVAERRFRRQTRPNMAMANTRRHSVI